MIKFKTVKMEINGVELTDARDASMSVEVEQIDVTPAMIVEPDRTWTHRDASGHFHAFSNGQESEPYPTLQRRTREVERFSEDDGEEWTDTLVWFECRICRVEVAPKMIESVTTHRETRPGRSSWHVEVSVTNGTPLPRNGDLCTVRLCEPTHEFFGVASVVSSRYSGMGAMVRVMLYGAGPLGLRTLPKP